LAQYVLHRVEIALTHAVSFLDLPGLSGKTHAPRERHQREPQNRDNDKQLDEREAGLAPFASKGGRHGCASLKDCKDTLRLAPPLCQLTVASTV
jgi:hypothetical protein